MYNDFFTTGVQTQEPGLFDALLAFGGGLLAVAIILALICIAVVVLIIVANCRIFVKAGEKWWKGIIPLYNSWVETKIAGLKWYWFVIFAILLAWTTGTGNLDTSNWVWSMALTLVGFNYNYNLCKKFGKSNSFAFWMTVLPFVFIPILGFGSAKYNKDAAVDENGVFSVKK